MEPPVSSPRAVAQRRAAAAAADPLLEPPVDLSMFQGFNAAGKDLRNKPAPANSPMCSFPRITAPPAFSFDTTVASSGGTYSRA